LTHASRIRRICGVVPISKNSSSVGLRSSPVAVNMPHSPQAAHRLTSPSVGMSFLLVSDVAASWVVWQAQQVVRIMAVAPSRWRRAASTP